MRSFYILILLFLISITDCLDAQSHTSISDNSRIFSVCYYEGRHKDIDTSVAKNKTNQLFYRYRIDAYDLSTRHKCSSFRLKFEKKEELDTVFLSANGDCINLSFEQRDIICQIKTGKILLIAPKFRHSVYHRKRDKKQFRDELTVAFANQDNVFVVAGNKSLAAYDTYSGKKLITYENVPVTSKIRKLYFSEDDHYLFLEDERAKIYIWKTGRDRILRRTQASEANISADKKSLVLNRNSQNNQYTLIYTFPRLRKTGKSDAGKFLRNLVKKEFEELREYNEKIKSNEIPPKYLDLKNSSISPEGRFTVIPIVTEEEYYSLYFVDNLGKDTIQPIHLKPYDIDIEYHWVNDSILFLDNNNLEKGMFNILTGRYVGKFNYNFQFEKGEPNISLNRQERDYHISPDLRYVALEYKTLFARKLFVQPGAYVQEKSVFEDVEFVNYTPDSKTIITRNDAGDYGFIPVYVIARDLGGMELDAELFVDTIQTIIESEILEDGSPPKDYHYARIKTIKHIGEQKSFKDQLKMHLKSMTQNDSIMEIQLHLIDQNDIYYYGAASDEWKSIFCNVLLKGEDKDPEQLVDFEIVEYDAEDSLINAFSIVMDHSGSMGNKRAVKLQEGTVNMINNKHDQDAMSVLKFDTKIGIESYLEKDTEKLTKKIQINGLNGFGGGTAILDGINAGIFNMKDETKFDEKSVILFTDGNENSSFTTKKSVVKRAIQNNIKVNTIGFGDYVSEEYLKAISYYTGGSYHRIYKTSDLDWIMEDIYTKSNNYYGLRLKMDTPGVYTVFLKLCPPAGKPDTLVVKFEYNPEKIKEIRLSKDFNFSMDIDDNVKDEININEFSVPDISDFENISVGNVSRVIEKEFKDTTNKMIVIEDEFEELVFPDIKFVFDKTDIIEGTDKELINVIEFMKKYKNIKIEVSGHTDEKGDFDYNQKLSEKRAQKVKELIVAHGILAQRIRTIGYGETIPVEDNKSKKGRLQNRRVEFSILK